MIELTPQNRKMIFVPKGFGHGYQSLTADTEILYLVSDAARFCTGQIWRANGGQTIPR